MKSPSIFYRRYVTEIDKKAALEQRFPLRGESPFGDGVIDIFEDGGFHCQATDRQGTAAEFLQALYPLLSDRGAKRAISIESENQPDLDFETFQSQLSGFRSSQIDLKLISEDFGVPERTLKNLPLWTKHDGSILSMMELSSIGQPICRTEWMVGQRDEAIYGVPRVQKAPEAKRVWFTENQLDATVLHQKINEPVYLRPSHTMLDWNDYQSSTKGKQVILLMERERGDWEYSSFPFLEKLREWDRDVRVVYIEQLTDSKPLMAWLQIQANLNILTTMIQTSERAEPVFYDKQTYHEYISRDKISIMYAPQDIVNRRFWYKLSCGEFVHSFPLNVCNSSELIDKFHIQVKGEEDHEIHLTKAQVLNISVSSNQLTPHQTYIRIKRFIDKYIYLDHPEFVSLISLWIMGGYIYQLFPAYAYIHLMGEKNTGKTTMLEIIAGLGFNGILESQSTRAKVVEQVHRLGCTACLDEFESSSIGTGDEYTQMLKGGYKKGGSYSKMAGKGKATRLNTYSPKVLASIDSIGDEALASRTIPVRTVIMPLTKEKIDWNGDDEKVNKHVESIRLGCYALGLYHHKKITRYLRQIPTKIDLPGGGKLTTRKRQIAAPLVAIAQLIDTNQKPMVEQELLTALEISWNQQKAEHIKRENLLAELLRRWNDDTGFESYRWKDQITWIDNACWEGEELTREVGGQSNLLHWFSEFPGVKKKSVHLNSTLGTKSSTGFPDDLKINKKPFRELFRRK